MEVQARCETCEQCGAEIRKPRQGRRFCSPRCRAAAWHARRVMFVPCTYCGVAATKMDEVPPVAVREALPATTAYPHVSVAACGECIGLLEQTRATLRSVASRRQYVKARLARHREEYARAEECSDEERAQLLAWIDRRIAWNPDSNVTLQTADLGVSPGRHATVEVAS